MKECRIKHNYGRYPGADIDTGRGNHISFEWQIYPSREHEKDITSEVSGEQLFRVSGEGGGWRILLGYFLEKVLSPVIMKGTFC